MGKKKIDLTKLIENQQNRSVAFCKRKRGLMLKAIELSSLCKQKILCLVYDPEKKRMIHYSSDPLFSMDRAYDALMACKAPEYVNLFESYTNEDYESLRTFDYRKNRYKKASLLGKKQFGKIQELDAQNMPIEDDDCSSDENCSERSMSHGAGKRS